MQIICKNQNKYFCLLDNYRNLWTLVFFWINKFEEHVQKFFTTQGLTLCLQGRFFTNLWGIVPASFLQGLPLYHLLRWGFHLELLLSSPSLVSWFWSFMAIQRYDLSLNYLRSQSIWNFTKPTCSICTTQPQTSKCLSMKSRVMSSKLDLQRWICAVHRLIHDGI